MLKVIYDHTKNVKIYINLVLCPDFLLGSKSHFSQWRIYFCQFIDKFLKFEVMDYLICYVQNADGLVLCQLQSYFQ